MEEITSKPCFFFFRNSAIESACIFRVDDLEISRIMRLFLTQPHNGKDPIHQNWK